VCRIAAQAHPGRPLPRSQPGRTGLARAKCGERDWSALLRIEQVRLDDPTEAGIAQQDWMGTVQADHVVGDLVPDRVFRIAGVLENIHEGPGAGVTDEGCPPVIETFSCIPTKVVVMVTVPARWSITGKDSLLGPAAKTVIDLPLSATKSIQKVPPKKKPFLRSWTTEVP
jgi:hypothetical protein